MMLQSKNAIIYGAGGSMGCRANVAVFLTSDLAGKITGVTVDVTAGTTAGLNYKVASQRN